jgi:hypothetical protein
MDDNKEEKQEDELERKEARDQEDRAAAAEEVYKLGLMPEQWKEACHVILVPVMLICLSQYADICAAHCE